MAGPPTQGSSSKAQSSITGHLNIVEPVHGCSLSPSCTPSPQHLLNARDPPALPFLSLLISLNKGFALSFSLNMTSPPTCWQVLKLSGIASCLSDTICQFPIPHILHVKPCHFLIKLTPASSLNSFYQMVAPLLTLW